MVLLFVLAGLIVGYNWFRNYKQDPGATVSYGSRGEILATQYLDEGQQVVIIKADGTAMASPGYVEGARDREATWKPDGSQVFFVSDRELEEPHIFRWSPGNNRVERRSLDARGKGGLEFSVPGTTNLATALMTSGGTVLEYDPTGPSMRQILPPVGKEVGHNEEGGSAGQFDIWYSQLGTSFKKARWSIDQKYIAAVMRRDEGEVLIVQDMVNARPPYPVAAGDRVDFDINPMNGDIAFSSIGFQFPNDEQVPEQFKQGGKITRPFNHVVGIIKPENPQQAALVVQMANDTAAFTSLKYSPDGSLLAMIVGPYLGDGMVEGREIVVMPAVDQGVRGAKRIIRAPAVDPSWSTDGKSLLYVKSEQDGTRPIFSIGLDGSNERRITQKGRFGAPMMSPAQ